MVWLQTADWFADIRLLAPTTAGPPGATAGSGAADPGAGAAGLLVGAWAFAGTAVWASPRMTWEHRFDTCAATADDASGPADAAVLDWDGPVLVERGSVPGPDGPVPYVERWARLEGSAPGAVALVDHRTVAVTSGSWRVTVTSMDGGPAGGPVHATLELRRGERWDQEGRVASAGPPPPGRQRHSADRRRLRP